MVPKNGTPDWSWLGAIPPNIAAVRATGSCGG